MRYSSLIKSFWGGECYYTFGGSIILFDSFYHKQNNQKQFLEGEFVNLKVKPTP